jgi:histidine triad (HIT) family protein
MSDTLFTKIINRQIPADIVYEDEHCFAIRDINPQAPVHLSAAEAGDQALLGHLMLAVGKITRDLKIDNAFRLAINNGADAGQSVFHLHLHILAGRAFSWPPG